MRLIPGRAKGGANDQTAFGMDLADLKVAMEEDLDAGLTPVFVNANCGTTNSCAIDPISAIGELCRRWAGAPSEPERKEGWGLFGAFAFSCHPNAETYL